MHIPTRPKNRSFASDHTGGSCNRVHYSCEPPVRAGGVNRPARTGFGCARFASGTGDGEDAPKIDGKCYCIWRFMIGCEYQKRGYGRQAMAAALDYIRTFPCGEAESVWLSYEPENKVAKALYESFGFRETGEISGGEAVAVLRL